MILNVPFCQGAFLEWARRDGVGRRKGRIPWLGRGMAHLYAGNRKRPKRGRCFFRFFYSRPVRFPLGDQKNTGAR